MSDQQDQNGGQELAELAALADGSLSPDRRAALEERVAADPELARQLAEQQRAVALMENAAAGVEAPMSLREGIERQRRTQRKPVLRRLAVAMPLAVAVVAVVVALGVFSSSESGEHFQVALAGTAGVSGEASLTKTDSGWRIELDASGLPRLDNGRFYQAWLRNPSGVLVPIGSFNEGENVTLWAGVSPKDFPLMTVTRELADGDQASSGDKVLAGTVDTSSD